MNMDIEEFDYDLPEELIAQTPLKNRSDSKLLVLDKETGRTCHEKFSKIISYLVKDDVLVLNDTKVIPARLIGEKESTKAVIELLLLKDLGNNTWESLVKPSRRIKVGNIISFGNGKLKAECILDKEEGIKHFKLIYEGILVEILEELGTMPLPPYIHKELKEQERYQTVYAKHLGSAAAPTAGLHFTKKLLKEIESKGIQIVYVTLHVGLGTFRPVKEQNILEHKMHSEYYEMTKETAEILNKAKEEGRRIISVGTTSTRTLETIYQKYNCFKECYGNTEIFIYPGYKFKAIDCLITNFHLPKSTLIMLVSALATKDYILNAYKEAIENKYRFFSFGDAMFITTDKFNRIKLKNSFQTFKKEVPVYVDKSFKIYKGTNNVMLSAPHAYKHLREGIIKNNEYNTSNIVKLLHLTTGCHIIFTYENNDIDANYNETSYRKKLSKYIDENNISYLLDIHGLEDNTDVDIEIGTNNLKSVLNDEKLVLKVKEIFEKYYNNIVIDNRFKASKKAISKYISKQNNVKTIQLEINKKARQMKKRPFKFEKTMKALEEIINYLKEE